LRGNAAKLDAIVAAIGRYPGVLGASANRQAGSVTVLYDTDLADRQTLLDALDALECGIPAVAHMMPAAIDLGGLSSQYLKETVAKTLVGAIVGTVVKSTVEPPVLTLLRVARVAR